MVLAIDNAELYKGITIEKSIIKERIYYQEMGECKIRLLEYVEYISKRAEKERLI